MSSHSEEILRALLDKGVKIPRPGSVEIGPEVLPSRISGEGVTIHAGCRVRGATTLLLPGATLGAEAPVSLTDCQLGRDVALEGGAFTGATFLDGAAMGSGAHVREGCLLEEGVRGAHTVGLKQTILFPFVTLGSLINFCDCLMAGGTGAKNHSEVGSSYIHFNYTPRQDKATPSLIGDVPRGVMLREPPIFLGGQGGLVGPVRIAYGTVLAAGVVHRRDVTEENTLVLGSPGRAGSRPFRRDRPANADRIIRRNVLYIGELVALRSWYRHVRSLFTPEGGAARALLEAAAGRIEGGIAERIRRLDPVAKAATGGLASRWDAMRGALEDGCGEEGDPQARAGFLAAVEEGIAERGSDYLTVIGELAGNRVAEGTAWLRSVVEKITERAGM